MREDGTSATPMRMAIWSSNTRGPAWRAPSGVTPTATNRPTGPNSHKQGWYFTGDSARRDEDGYFWIIGRMDDVIKVSGYRLGTAEVESALVSHPPVAEAAVSAFPTSCKAM